MLFEVKMWIVPVAALIPLIIGFIWYNPKVLGTAWMNSAGLTEEKLKGANMIVIVGLSYVFSCLVGFALLGLTIHQYGLNSLVMDADALTMTAAKALKPFVIDNFRTFKHGVLHGVFAGITLALPLLGTNALFERKGFKYILINVGYWIISLGLMGGVICQFA